jgi:phage-related holin
MEEVKQDMIYTPQVSGGISWDDLKNFMNGVAATLSIILHKYLEYSGLSTKAINMLVILLIADTFTGWIKGMVLNIYSRKQFYYGVMKKLVLLVIPVVLKALTAFAQVEGDLLFNTYCIIIAIHEAESFFGNIYTIRTGKLLPEKDILSILAKSIYGFLDNLIEKMLKIFDNHKNENND